MVIKKLNKNNVWLFGCLVSILALSVWAVFQPGFMNADAVVIYSQAKNASYQDWHPPIMAFTLKLFFDLGLGLKELMLIQCQLGYIGLYLSIYQLLRILKVNASAYTSFWTILGFTLPFSPFPFYAMGFIKDSWCMIFLLWVIGLSIYLYRKKSVSENRLKKHVVLISIIFFMVLTILARHNALVLFPIYLIIIYGIGKLNKMKKASVFLYCFLPILLWGSFNEYAYHVIKVERQYPERQVMSAELIGLLKLDSTKCSSMTYVGDYLTPNWRDAYQFGEVSAVMPWGWKHSVKFPDFDRDHPGLEQDYYHSLKTYPFSMLWVKIRSFSHMLHPSQYKYWSHLQLDKNQYGLLQNQTFSGFRKEWINLALKLREPLNILVADHLFWFVINFLVLLTFWRKKYLLGESKVFFFFLLLIPFAYYFSYLIAATSWNYRFMYPSTILIQVTFISLLIKFIQDKKKTISA
jgi:hypothetical protein